MRDDPLITLLIVFVPFSLISIGGGPSVFAGIQHQAQALGGPIAWLEPEEGRIADIVNVDTVGRSWDAWKQRVA